MNYKKMCDLATFIADKEVDMATFLPKDKNKFPHDVLVAQAKRYRSREEMDAIVNDCGTACCIAGWTALKHGKGFAGDTTDDVFDLPNNIRDFAAKELELTGLESSMLFTPDGWSRPMDKKIQRERMMGVLRGEILLNYGWLHNPRPRITENEGE